MAWRKFSGSSESTKVVVIPNFGKVAVKRLYVPPYRVLAETISSPVPAILKMALVIAAEPDANASAPIPPSSAATLFFQKHLSLDS